MRVNLFEGGRRPWYFSLGLRLMKARIGLYPGPPLAITYRPDLFSRRLVGYIFRGSSGLDGWDKGHAELFSAFVSHLNSCRF
ncbi:MAG: hypothetical protein JNJ54_36840 [Myxococcaceae bacterium]|nr:hypothetical protein [Myxococcaceae bacterium]